MNMISQIADTMMGQRVTATPAKPLLSTTETMHALIWNKAGDVRYAQTPRPLISAPQDIILRVTATTICGSDIHLYDGSVPAMRSGDILGHEFVGTVEEVGEEVKNLKKGQRVVVAFDIACGTCEFCTRKEYSVCKMTNPSNLVKSMYGHRTSAIYGYSHLTGGVPGGQAEFVRVPYADVNCLLIPDDLPDEKAVFLADVVPTAYHGAKLGSVKKGDVVAIWGMGPIGLMCAKFCVLKGASRIVGIDCVSARLIKARELGIDTLDYSEHDTVTTLRDIFPDGVDVAIECVGGEYSKTLLHRVERALNLETDSSDIFSEMFQCVRPCGRVAVIGVYVGFANHFPVGAMMEMGLVVSCGQAPVQKYWKKCMDLMTNGTIDPSFLITHRGDLSRGPELYKMFTERSEGILKVIMRPEGASHGKVLEKSF